MIRLLVATRNGHKTREIQQILGQNFTISDLSEHPEIPEVCEKGKSLKENATLKAIAVSKMLGTARRAVRTSQRNVPTLVIADDSGMEVDALDGAPGIFSARYAGQNASDKENVQKLLSELARIGQRGSNKSARFRCVIVLAREGQLLGTFEGIVEGTIAGEPRGMSGFGYDPIFVPNGFKQTFAELPADVKNHISHRAKAIGALTARLAVLHVDD